MQGHTHTLPVLQHACPLCLHQLLTLSQAQSASMPCGAFNCPLGQSLLDAAVLVLFVLWEPAPLAHLCVASAQDCFEVCGRQHSEACVGACASKHAGLHVVCEGRSLRARTVTDQAGTVSAVWCGYWVLIAKTAGVGVVGG